MNLSDELQALARSAPPSADPDVVVRLARVRRARRTIGGSALLVLVVALPLWLWVDGRMAEPAAVRVTLTFTVEAPPGSLERTRGILQERAEAMRLVAPQVTIVDDRTIMVEAGLAEGMRADWLAQPGRLQVRKVLRRTAAQQTLSSPAGTPAQTLEELKAKLGGAYAAAVTLTAPAKSDDGFEVFATLTPAEVALLPLAVQFHVPTVTCDQLKNRPGGLPADKKDVVACDDGDAEKLVLGGARLTGADVAAATPSESEPGQYRISLRMARDGGPKWTQLIREAFHNTGAECGAAVGDEGRCLLAFMVDGNTISAPEIRAESVSTYFEGYGPMEEAKRIAAEIGPHELPAGVTLTPR